MGRRTRLVWLSGEICSVTHLQDQHFPDWARRGVSSQAGGHWGQAWTSGEKGTCPLPGIWCACAVLECRSQAGQTSPRGSGLYSPLCETATRSPSALYEDLPWSHALEAGLVTYAASPTAATRTWLGSLGKRDLTSQLCPLGPETSTSSS